MAKAVSGIERALPRLRAAPKLIQQQMRTAVEAGGVLLAASARHEIGVDKLSHVGHAGASVGAESSTKGTVRPTAFIRATGPLHLLDNPTKAHDVRARAGRALNTPYGPKSKIHTPGTRGKHLFDKGIAKGLPAARTIVEAAFVRAGRSLGGSL